MRKKIEKIIQEAIRESFKDYILISLKYTGFVILFLFLIKSISLSQAISPLYFRIFNVEKSQSGGDKEAVVGFLRQIRDLSEYDKYISLAKNIYGDSIDEEIQKDFLERQTRIDDLEEILQKNPKARDVLYSLYRLYEAQGDKLAAEEYLNRALEVDPNLNL